MKRILLSAGIALLVLAPAARAQRADAAVLPANAALELMLLRVSALSRCDDGCAVRGLPYSAERVTESVRVLADGNRIVRRNVDKVYRDSDGRTRVESEWNGKPLVLIQDVVAGMSYRLYPATRTGYRMAIAAPAAPSKAAGAAVTEAGPSTPGVARLAEQLSPALNGAGVAASAETRSLGRKQIEGLAADGEITTATMPAGTLGNAQPIVLTTEAWTARDLRVPVLMKSSNPFSGESLVRLQNLARLEPSTALFAVPADYTVQEVVRR